MPRDGIEPPTRGFSTREGLPGSDGESGPSVEERRGCGAVSDPDAALKEAIKVAVDEGQYERARALLDVLAKTPSVGAVLDLAKRRGF